jgi:hypothetical protein
MFVFPDSRDDGSIWSAGVNMDEFNNYVSSRVGRHHRDTKLN